MAKERCELCDKQTEKLATVDKEASVLKNRVDYIQGEVNEMKAEMLRFEQKIDGLPEQIAARLPKSHPAQEQKPWYLSDKAMNAAILSLILAAAKLLEKLAQ